MADLTITPANVIAGTDASNERGTAGETILAGKAIAKNAAGALVLADSNGAAALRVVRGISLHGASAGQPLTIQREGSLTIGATLVAGTDYWLSDTPGGICPRADVASGENVVQIGIATSTAVMTLAIKNTGVQL